MAAMADQRPRITEFNVGNFEGSLYEGGWHKEPRFKACYGSEELTRHVKPQNDGLGSEGYLNLAEKAEQSGSSLKRGACIVGVMKYAVAPANSIPKAFKERVQRRLNKGEREDEQVAKSARATKRVRKSAPAEAAVPTADQDARAMPPPQGVPAKRRDLFKIRLNDFVPAALSNTEARLVAVPADEVVVVDQGFTPSVRMETTEEEQQQQHQQYMQKQQQRQDQPPPLLSSTPSAHPFSFESPAVSSSLNGLLSNLSTPMREDELLASMAAKASSSFSNATALAYLASLASPAQVPASIRQSTPAPTPASYSELAQLLSPMYLLQQTTPALVEARTSQREESLRRPDTADLNNLYAVMDSIQDGAPKSGSVAAAAAASGAPSIDTLEL